jgi:hypothetical protein
MTKKHHNDGPTFTPLSTKKKPRPTPPSPDRKQAQLDEDIRTAAKRRALNHELKTNPGAFIQRIIARKKKLRGEQEE